MMSAAIRSALAAATLALFAPTALADSTDDAGVMFGLRGVTEVWQDPSIVTNYRSSRFAGAGFLGVGLTDWLAIDAELGFMRQDAAVSRAGVASGALQLVPVTLGLQYRRDSPAAELFAGMGFATVAFAEETSVGVVAGAKAGLDVRGGVRIHTNLAREPMPGPESPGVRMLDVELLLGRRQHHAFGIGSGFDLSAWRVGIGLAARL